MRPCPFCGGAEITPSFVSRARISCYCRTCDCRGPSVLVLNHWNRDQCDAAAKQAWEFGVRPDAPHDERVGFTPPG